MNTFFSWLSAIMVFILALLYPMQKLLEKHKPKPCSALATTYNLLCKTHIVLGILVIPVVFCHSFIEFM